jgi:hypothetical protein
MGNCDVDVVLVAEVAFTFHINIEAPKFLCRQYGPRIGNVTFNHDVIRAIEFRLL